ncbi:hypothetical protein K7432_010318 [Basidiobolus ranarum]|uniref:Uncharacterized protein n=1 Tax=Basidiobolus ranarum TaxID=34480 RepID=A0ABR2VWJ8_9FUNG
MLAFPETTQPKIGVAYFDFRVKPLEYLVELSTIQGSVLDIFFIGALILICYVLKAIFRGFFEKNIRSAIAVTMIIYLIVTAFFPIDALHELVFVDPVQAIFDFRLVHMPSFKTYVVIAYLLGIVSCYLLVITWQVSSHDACAYREYISYILNCQLGFLWKLLDFNGALYCQSPCVRKVTGPYCPDCPLCQSKFSMCVDFTDLRIGYLDRPDLSIGARKWMRLITLAIILILLSFLSQRLSTILLDLKNVYTFMIPALIYSVSEVIMYGIIVGFLCFLNSVESIDGVYVDYWEPTCYVHFGTGQSELDRLTLAHTQVITPY